MKKTLLKVLSVAVAITLFTACDNSEENGAQPEITAEDKNLANDDANADMEFDLAEEEAIQVYEASANSNGRVATVEGIDACVSITASEDSEFKDNQLVYTKTVTLDFGTEGCSNESGDRVRKGIVTLTHTFTLGGEDNAFAGQYTISLDGYEVNGTKIEGTRTRTSEKVAEGQFVHTAVLTGGKITFEDGTEVTREAEWSMTHSLGGERTLTGSATGTNRNGTAYTTTISEDAPVVTTLSCDIASKLLWIPVSGSKHIQAGDRSITLDFGTGECDKVATLTVETGDNSTTTEIEIGRWRKRND
ncbi:hypothetical protein V6R21_10310 [Limibacter armeniacum]|uniref:hypothetical protein n=1 Tax=Limibacter armeniacum TaxID=466084 RepID=UPI002FE58B69